MANINVPGTLLGIWFVWHAIVNTGVTSLFGIFTLITGIVWLVVSLGIVGRIKGL